MLFEAVINYLCAVACRNECIKGAQSLVGRESYLIELRGQVDSTGSMFLSWLEPGSPNIFVELLSPCRHDFFLSSTYILNYYPLIIISLKSQYNSDY
jgi:hypothetical protein